MVEGVSDEKPTAIAKAAVEGQIVAVEEIFTTHADGVAQTNSAGSALVPGIAKTRINEGISGRGYIAPGVGDG